MSNSIIIVRRFIELFLTNFTISAFITILYKIEILHTQQSITLSLIIGAAIFFAVNINMLRNCYCDMGKYHKEYYILNTAAYLLYAIVCFAVYVFGSGEMYTWLFSITKLIKYTVDGVATHYSALFFHIIGLATVFLSPAGINFVEFVEE